MSKSDLNTIGLHSKKLDVKIKGHMVQEQVRSRLIYGLENCELSEDKISKLETFENNILKEYIGISRKSISRPILEIAKIKSFSEALAIRKLSFLAQLVSNSLTNKIINSEIEHGVTTLVTKCGYTSETGDDTETKTRKIMYLCTKMIKEIKVALKSITMDAFTSVIEYLLKHQTHGNKRLLHFMLSAKHNVRGVG